MPQRFQDSGRIVPMRIYQSITTAGDESEGPIVLPEPETNILEIVSQSWRTVYLEGRNEDTTNTVTQKIYATRKFNQSVPPQGDTFWTVTEDHWELIDTQTSIGTSTNATPVELVDKGYTYIVVTGDGENGVASSGTVTAATVLEETKATGEITLNGMTGEVHSLGTVQCTSVSSGDIVTINGLTYTAVTGARPDNLSFSVDTSDAATAIDLAAAINADVRAGTLNDVSASPTTDTVTVTQTVGGAAGDATTLAEDTSGARIIISGATFGSGVTGDFVTVNGLVYTATVGARANDTEFSIDTSNTAAATDLAAAISADVRSPITVPTIDVTATSSVADVTLIPATTRYAVDAHAIDIAESTSGVRGSVSGAVMASGVNADFFTVNGLEYKAVAGSKADNTEFSTDTGNNETAADLALSITDDSRTGITVPTLDQTAVAVATDEVTITCTTITTLGNTIDLSSTDGTTLAVSGALMTGGLDTTSSYISRAVLTA